MVVKEEIIDKLKDFIDAFETEYGDVEGDLKWERNTSQNFKTKGNSLF
jgi:hypothetical protein